MGASLAKALKKVQKTTKMPFLTLFGGLFSCHIYKKDPYTIQMVPKGANRVFAPYHNSFVWPEHL